jgi:hypothetical protein
VDSSSGRTTRQWENLCGPMDNQLKQEKAKTVASGQTSMKQPNNLMHPAHALLAFFARFPMHAPPAFNAINVPPHCVLGHFFTVFLIYTFRKVIPKKHFFST